MSAKIRVAIVAALKATAGQGYGGQLAAASALVNSRFAEQFTLVPFSLDARPPPQPPLVARVAIGVSRVVRFAALLPKADVVLVFAASGLSLVEKGLMCLMARAAGKGVVVRLSAGDLPAQCDASSLFKRWVERVLASAHVVVSQGSVWTTYFESFPQAHGKVVEIVNGIAPPPPGPTAARRAGPRVGFVGWIQREKGVFEALAMLERLRPRYPDVELVLAGGGDADLTELRQRARAAGLDDAVVTLGWVGRKDIYPLIRSFDVLVLPSHFEGLANVVLEAMAVDKPVVATRVGALADAIVDGETGYLVDVGDVDALTDRVARLLADPVRAGAMGHAGGERFRARFDVERAWPLFAEAVERAAAEARFTTSSPEAA